MGSDILIVGSASDRMLECLHAQLCALEHRVAWLKTLNKIGLSLPIAQGPGGASILIEDRRINLDATSCLVFVDASVVDDDIGHGADKFYRRTELMSAWMTLFCLFPGYAINRPSSMLAPVYADPLLARTLARSLGVATLADRIGAKPHAPAGDFVAATDVASGVTFWAEPSAQSPSSLLSYLDYSPSADHCLVAVVAGEHLVFRQMAAGVFQRADAAAPDWPVPAARRILGAIGLNYGHAVFVREEADWKFSRLFMAPPPILDANAVEAVANHMAGEVLRHVVQ